MSRNSYCGQLVKVRWAGVSWFPGVMPDALELNLRHNTVVLRSSMNPAFWTIPQHLTCSVWSWVLSLKALWIDWALLLILISCLTQPNCLFDSRSPDRRKRLPVWQCQAPSSTVVRFAGSVSSNPRKSGTWRIRIGIQRITGFLSNRFPESSPCLHRRKRVCKLESR